MINQSNYIYNQSNFCFIIAIFNTSNILNMSSNILEKYFVYNGKDATKFQFSNIGILNYVQRIYYIPNTSFIYFSFKENYSLILWLLDISGNSTLLNPGNKITVLSDIISIYNQANTFYFDYDKNTNYLITVIYNCNLNDVNPNNPYRNYYDYLFFTLNNDFSAVDQKYFFPFSFYNTVSKVSQSASQINLVKFYNNFLIFCDVFSCNSNKIFYKFEGIFLGLSQTIDLISNSRSNVNVFDLFFRLSNSSINIYALFNYFSGSNNYTLFNMFDCLFFLGPNSSCLESCGDNIGYRGSQCCSQVTPFFNGKICSNNCEDKNFDTNSNNCVDGCQILNIFNYQNICTKSCPSNTLVDRENKTCTYCLGLNLFIYKDMCFPNCPINNGVIDNSTMICKPCSNFNFYCSNSYCFKTCPINTIADSNNVCVKNNNINGKQYLK